MRDKQHNIYDLNEARQKIRAFCVYRERSQVEVRDKLISYGLIPDAVEQLLTELIQENFLNEERFARAFVRGKFRIRKWGRNKIKNELYRHDLSDYILLKAFSEIDREEYERNLDELVKRKRKEVKEKNSFKRNGIIARWLIGKGYEAEIVWEKLKD